MAPTLEIRHLQLVDAIAETGTVTAAAGRLHVTQSALSHQLRDIESRLGVALFERMGRRMVLTPAGTRVIRAGQLAAVRITRPGVFRPWIAVLRRDHRRRPAHRPWMHDFIELLAAQGLPGRVQSAPTRRRA